MCKVQLRYKCDGETLKVTLSDDASWLEILNQTLEFLTTPESEGGPGYMIDSTIREGILSAATALHKAATKRILG